MCKITKQNIIVLGDLGVGKSSFLNWLAEIAQEKKNEQIFLSHIFENKKYELSFLDTEGINNFDNLKKNIYKDADLFLICYDSSDSKSFATVNSKWISEIVKNTTGQVEYLTLGLKYDLSQQNKKNKKTQIFESSLDSEDTMISESITKDIETYEWKISTKEKDQKQLYRFLDEICEEIYYRTQN
eukprot:gene7611-11934_t